VVAPAAQGGSVAYRVSGSRPYPILSEAASPFDAREKGEEAEADFRGRSVPKSPERPIPSLCLTGQSQEGIIYFCENLRLQRCND